MATTSRRVNTASRQPSKLAKTSSRATEQLASELASKLTLNNDKGKMKVLEIEDSSSSMRSVNEASQALSGVVQSGWKRSSSDSRTTLSTVASITAKATKHLDTLRRLRPGDLDVERAAASILGKLVALEMFESASTSITAMQPRLLGILKVKEHPTDILSIPEPPSLPTDPIILNLISIYLFYAITIKTQTIEKLEELSITINSPSTRSLLTWIPVLSTLPVKHVDSLLTRAYTALNKLCLSKPKTTPSPESIFILRMYALRCLAHTSSGTIEANTFWNQATRFSAAFVKSTPAKGEGQTTSMILHAYSELVSLAEKRSDRDTFLAVDEKGDGFTALCEHWMVFAKRAGDIVTLQRIDAHITQQSSSSSSSLPSLLQTPAQSIRLASELSSTPNHLPQGKDSIINATRIYNSFSQALIVLDSPGNSDSGRTLMDSPIHSTKMSIFEAALSAIEDCRAMLLETDAIVAFLRPAKPNADKRTREEEQLLRITSKVERALDKLRRSSLKLFESNAASIPQPRSTNKLHCCLISLLTKIVDCLRSSLALPDLDVDFARDTLTRSLETLFSLSKIGLDLNDPSTLVTSYEHLKQAVVILNLITPKAYTPTTDDQVVDIANYMRCVSGAFYNISGTLYQAFRYGNAVPFLIEACLLGEKALRLPRVLSQPRNETREKEWSQLEDQLFRRWELLAVCYSKNGDRKNAYDAFKQAIHTFPFSSSGFFSQCNLLGCDAIFGASASPAIKQLVGLVDRISYLGACELLLEPSEVSILSAASSLRSYEASHGYTNAVLDPSVAGILLERQLDSLESSRWKDGMRAVFIKLLQDSLKVFSAQDENNSPAMPIRKARTLVRCLEFLYRDHFPDGCKALGYNSIDEIAIEIEDLLGNEDLGNDDKLSPYKHQYIISAQLWVALHAHRRVDRQQTSIMAQRTENACILMKEFLSGSPEKVAKARKSSSPKAIKKIASPIAARIVSPRQTRVTRQRLAPPPAPRKAPPARTRTTANPVTPKPRARIASRTGPSTINQTPPRRPSTEGLTITKTPSTLVFDNFDKMLSLLQLTSVILGFLSLTLSKAKLLDMTRKIAQRYAGSTSDGYVLASLDLAHEYVVLGKLKRASSIFYPALDIVRTGQASDDVSVRFLLRFSEAMSIMEDVPKSYDIYLEALEISNRIDLEKHATSTQQKIFARAKILELAALAAHAFGRMQYTKGDICASLDGLLQSLRLWNRAVETLTRLNPSPSPQPESDPFDMSSLKEALPSDESNTPSINPSGNRSKPPAQHPYTNGLEWRVSEGLLSTMFTLAQTYYLRGSAREAEYFAKQTADLATHLNTPGMLSRALAKQGEIQLHLGQLEKARACLSRASTLLLDVPGLDKVEIHRLEAEVKAAQRDEESTQLMFDDSIKMLEDLDAAFRQFDNLALGPRKSLSASPRAKESAEVLAPGLLATLLCHQLWLLRDEVDETFNVILEKLLSLSYSRLSKAEENILMGRLTLHGVYGRFRTDMFTSSLTESTIAIPMGMGSRERVRAVMPSAEVLDALANAENYFSDYLKTASVQGNVVKVREAAVSLALISAFRTSLGDKKSKGPTAMATLLDAAAALTLRSDMLDAISQKIQGEQYLDDMQWPILSEDGNTVVRCARPSRNKFTPNTCESDDEDDELTKNAEVLRSYWVNIRLRYQSQNLGSSLPSSSETVGLPDNWTIINVTVTQDKNTLFVSRQHGGSEPKEPLIFCIPLKGRRDHAGEEEEGNLTFEGALEELRDIIRSSDECTKQAVNIRPDDDEARSNWWKQRGELDTRLRDLLENIEYCWLGAFKTIFSPRCHITQEAISELGGQFERVFHRCLHVKDKKTKSKSTHKKSTSQPQTNSPPQFSIDHTLVECFSTLSPKCRDEELEDLVYFILDLYQFHGVPVAIAEVDIDQVVIDIRTILEEHSSKLARLERSSKTSFKSTDEHIFLVLDKNVQGLPWESMPILRGRSVSRIPGIQFLHDRLSFAKVKRGEHGQLDASQRGALIDPRKGFFVLNPSGDLSRTEERFREWTKDMKAAGWDGVVGRAITEQEFVNALKRQDLVVYFGHGGGEQYVRSHRIRSLPSCAATMLWGCSSGALREMGDFDRTGTPYNYMLAGCPSLVANLWDVTDKDIDKLSQAVFDKLGLTGKDLNQTNGKNTRKPTSIVAAVSQSRNSCKLKYLTGAAPVVYGIPFYI